MNNNISKFVMFAVGAAFGSVITWKVVKTKYEQIAQEEIDSVKETFRKRVYKEQGHEYESTCSEKRENNINKYEDVLVKYNYALNNTKNEEKKENMINKDYPYVISPEEFGEYPDYEVTSLTYYADGVLTDETDTPINEEDIEEIIGEDALNRFGEYEDDSVFVRDDSIKMDYEILADERRYSEIDNTKDYPVE